MRGDGSKPSPSAPVTPIWRKVFDRIEREVAPRVESVTKSSPFGDAIAVLTSARADFNRRAGRVTATFWHALNLPAGTDIRRLRNQVASLERRVRNLDNRLEEEETPT